MDAVRLALLCFGLLWFALLYSTFGEREAEGRSRAFQEPSYLNRDACSRSGGRVLLL